MKLGDVANAEAAPYGKPLAGVRVLAIEQMQSLPYATQMLARLGADVVKVEHPTQGESGRGSQPAMIDPAGRSVGATFLRNNLGKRSVGIDLKHPEGRALVLGLAPRFDVVAENFKAGTIDRLGLGYDDVRAVHPGVIYLSLSGFGATEGSAYADWPAYAAIVEAMSGIYDYNSIGGAPPRANPVGALGDISSALFATIGVLAALRHRDRTGEGQRIDIAMYDAAIAMTDVVMNFFSLGIEHMGGNVAGIMDSFRAADGWFVMQVVRPHQFKALAEFVGHPEWLDDPHLADGFGWRAQLESVIRPAVEGWAHDKPKDEVVNELVAAGIVSGPCHTARDLIADPQVARRNMIVEMERTDGVEQPVLIPGNPVKLSKVAEGPETRVPWVGEHTAEVLGDELGLAPDALERLQDAGVIGGVGTPGSAS